jgi:hypothetical protein
MKMIGIVVALSIAGVACVQEPTIPKIGDPNVAMQLTVSASQLAPGQIDTITVTVSSHDSLQLRILFPSSCQVLLYIRNSRSRTVVPSGGEYDCVSVPSQLTIPAGGTTTQQFFWAGVSALEPSAGAPRLPDGDYYVSASMTTSGVNAVAFAKKVTLVQ